MPELQEATPFSNRPARKSYTLALLRSAAARARLIANEIDFIGVSLQHQMISPEQAIAMLHDAGGACLILQAPRVVSEAKVAA
jgi:hypothetical protein